VEFMKVYIVDAFTSEPFKGNPAGVCLVDSFPSDAECLKIAAELNLSETAFVKRESEENRFSIRWFSPKVEVKLCGHGTLASAHILWEEKLVQGSDIQFDSLSGPLFVKRNDNFITLNFPTQVLTLIEHPPAGLLEALNETPLAVYKFAEDLLVELENEDKIYNFVPDFEKILAVNCRGIIITARGKGEFDFVSRFFVPRGGVPEDPVTGSAHCKLVPYWGSKLNKRQFKAYQASPRGGTLNLEWLDDRVLLSGEAVTVLKGDLNIPIVNP